MTIVLVANGARMSVLVSAPGMFIRYMANHKMTLFSLSSIDEQLRLVYTPVVSVISPSAEGSGTSS